MTEPRIGYCLGSLTRPHVSIEWQGCYTICLYCHAPLRYDTPANVERITQRQRPDWWAPEKVIGWKHDTDNHPEPTVNNEVI